MAKAIKSERKESSAARVPSVSPGHAIVVTRYAQEKAVIMNPDDFHRLAALDEALEEIADRDRLEMTELVHKAHQLEDQPSGPLEDPAAIRALLGL